MINLKDVWSVLQKPNETPGWQTLGIHPEAPCVIRAGVRYPELREGILIEVPASFIPANAEYPEARGFDVAPERLTPGINGMVRLALTRSKTGNPDLFSILADDIVSRVAQQPDIGTAVATFFSRLRAWRTFMQQHEGQRLSEVEETGLMGELLFLEQVLFDQMGIGAALHAWQGPMGGVRDFLHKDHGIELKATASPLKQIVRISSLDQLDEQALLSLNLVLARLAPRPDGLSLPELIGRIRKGILESSAELEPLFDNLLLQAGYMDAQAELYTRRLILMGFAAWRVNGAFPRITRAGLPVGILEATYDIDLGAADAWLEEVQSMLKRILE